MPGIADLLAGYPVIIQLPVVWGEMDSYRHVNNVVYFRYLESARVEYCARLNWFEFEEATGIGPILQATQARFRRPLTYPDTVSVTTRVAAMDRDRFTIDHLIVSHRQEEIVTVAQGTVVTFHYPSAKKVPIPEELRRRIEALEGKRFG
jgi:acyl-CoA thioester hydrolase